MARSKLKASWRAWACDVSSRVVVRSRESVKGDAAVGGLVWSTGRPQRREVRIRSDSRGRVRFREGLQATQSRANFSEARLL
jgi:hypothetical protein